MTPRDRLCAALDDPVMALSGDLLMVSGTDLLELIRQFDLMKAALGTIGAPSFKQIPMLRNIANEALRTA